MNNDLILFSRTELGCICDIVGTTKKDFYNYIGVSQPEITKISRGETDWKVTHLRQMREFLIDRKYYFVESSPVIACLIERNFKSFSDILMKGSVLPIFKKRLLGSENSRYRQYLYDVVTEKNFNRVLEATENQKYIFECWNVLKKLPELVTEIDMYCQKMEKLNEEG